MFLGVEEEWGSACFRAGHRVSSYIQDHDRVGSDVSHQLAAQSHHAEWNFQSWPDGAGSGGWPDSEWMGEQARESGVLDEPPEGFPNLVRFS